MTNSDEMFLLIKSLTPAEKRYFKIHASKHVIGNSNNYEKLFDALDALPSDQPYDEDAFKRSLKGKSFGRYLSDEKAQLREALLKSMRVFHAERTPRGRLAEMVHEISFLYSKGLLKNCRNLIEKALALARETEQYTEVLVLNGFLLKLYRTNTGDAPFTIDEIEAGEKEICKVMMAERRALYLSARMRVIVSRSLWTEKAEEMQAILAEQARLLQIPGISQRTEFSLLDVRLPYLNYAKKYREGLEITKDFMQRNEARGNQKDFMREEYRYLVSNYMSFAMMCEELELLPEAIYKLRGLPVNSEREEADNFRLGVQYELLYMVNTKQKMNPELVLPEIDKGLKKYARFIPEVQLVNFRFNAALTYFMHRNYSLALNSLRALDELIGRNKKYDHVLLLSRCMEWMCQSSLGNAEILDSLLRNLKYFFSEREMENDFLKTMFRLFSDIYRNGNHLNGSNAAQKEKIALTDNPPEFGQLKELVMCWL